VTAAPKKKPRPKKFQCKEHELAWEANERGDPKDLQAYKAKQALKSKARYKPLARQKPKGGGAANMKQKR